MKLTGERPIEGVTPDSLLALHDAGYREVIERLDGVAATVGPGALVLDVGCGLGDESVRLADGGARTVVGVDYDPETAALAVRRHGALGVRALCGDGGRIGLRGGVFDSVCSSHLIEHFVDPEPHVEEVSRVLSAHGTAFFLTPNAPADFENPYHVCLFEPDQLRTLLEKHFGSVEVIGLDAVAAVKADFERRRRLARRLLAVDVFDLRHRLPREWFVRLHAVGRRVAYTLLSRKQSQGNSGITADDFFTTDQIDQSTLVLMAICTRPHR